MLSFGHNLLRLAVLVTAVCWPLVSTACNVPVFRYALERWEADPYELVVFHRDPLTAGQQVLVEKMEKAGRDGLANLAVTRVNLAAEVSPPLQSLWAAQQNSSLPWVVLRYPRLLRIEPPAWVGPLGAESAGTLLDSPGRREISQKLLNGDAVVWLLLESGDRERDLQAAQRVEAETKQLQQTLVLPELSPQDPPILADLPLKIAFSTVRITRSDPAEQVLVGMLLNRDSNLVASKEPMLFPVFGRGRVIPPAIGEEIQAEAIREMAVFLTGPCSCQVKELNPGYDLLLSATWSSLVGYQEVLLPEPPPLVSMSEFAATAASNVPATSTPAKVSLATASTPVAPAESHPLVRNLVIVVAIGAAFLLATTFVLKLRANRGPR